MYRKEILRTKCALRGFIKVRYSFKNTIKSDGVQYSTLDLTALKHTRPHHSVMLSCQLYSENSLLCGYADEGVERPGPWCSSHRPRQWDPPSPLVSGDM